MKEEDSVEISTHILDPRYDTELRRQAGLNDMLLSTLKTSSI